MAANPTDDSTTRCRIKSSRSSSGSWWSCVCLGAGSIRLPPACRDEQRYTRRSYARTRRSTSRRTEPEPDRHRASGDDQTAGPNRTRCRTRRTRAMKTWARNTSITFVLFATLAHGDLAPAQRAAAGHLQRGTVLLGGLFTMLYGVGWVGLSSSGNSTARFIVILFALVVALGLGYLKLVEATAVMRSRSSRRCPAPRHSMTPEVAGLAARVSVPSRPRRLPGRAALGGEDEPASVAPQCRGVPCETGARAGALLALSCAPDSPVRTGAAHESSTRRFRCVRESADPRGRGRAPSPCVRLRPGATLRPVPHDG